MTKQKVETKAEFISKKCLDELPIDIQEYFKADEPEFLVDEFEELIIQDIMQSDENTRIKLNKDVTGIFSRWLDNKRIKKENISLNIKGQTRSGKSLVIIKIGEKVIHSYEKPFDIEKMVCGNQKEYRQKLNKANFGDFYVIDENAFANSGEGANLESRQLKDIQNIIAKENIHTGYVTPRAFLPTNAELGLSYWGKDSKNWLSRFLLYKLSVANPVLIGYVIINVGSLFYEYGCMFFKHFGGCTNPERLRFKKIGKNGDYLFDKVHTDGFIIEEIIIPKSFIDNQRCISKEFLKNPDKAINNLTEKQAEKISCPFLNVCSHPMCRYEHKKDRWIDKEMKGGMDERTRERFLTAIKLMQKIGTFDVENQRLMIKATSGKDLVIKVKMYINRVSSTKYTITETEEIINAIKSFNNLDFLVETLKELELDVRSELCKIENVEEVIDMLDIDMVADKDKSSEESN